MIPEEDIAYIKNGDFRFYRDAKPGRELLINQDNETLSLIEIDHNQSIKVLAQLYPRAGKRGIIGKI